MQNLRLLSRRAESNLESVGAMNENIQEIALNRDTQKPDAGTSFRWKDFMTLTKPRITAMSLLMAAGGVALAPGRADLATLCFLMLGTALSVGSANTLNMFIEREGDKLMKRTASRPLPSGRMRPSTAISFGLILGLLSVVVLHFFVNPLTAALSTFALFSYVCIYTPLKRRTPLALLIGAVPGAIPPLLGWTAVQNSISAPGIVLFAVLLVWQIPHFIAISLYLKADYAAAGIRTVPVVRGDKNAKWQALAYSIVLLPLSLMLVPLEIAGVAYFSIATVMGVWFLGMSIKGLLPHTNPKWARQFFLLSLVYLPALTLGLFVDRVFL